MYDTLVHLLSVGGTRHTNYIIFCKTEQHYFKDEALSFALFLCPDFFFWRVTKAEPVPLFNNTIE